MLGSVNLSLQDLLSLLALGQLLPERRVRGQLLLEIIDFELVSLSHQHLLEFIHKPLLANDILQSHDLLPCFLLVGLQ